LARATTRHINDQELHQNRIQTHTIMNQSIIKFRGPAALPGITLSLIRVNRGRDCFFSFMQTGHPTAGRAFSPLNSVSYQLVSESFTYPIKGRILSKGWNIEKCAFRMWLIGRIDQHPSCIGLSLHDCYTLLWILALMINAHLETNGHETVRPHFGTAGSADNKRLQEIALILFAVFLRDIAPILMEDLDLDDFN
jgi:hypothetical protein